MRGSARHRGSLIRVPFSRVLGALIDEMAIWECLSAAMKWRWRSEGPAPGKEQFLRQRYAEKPIALSELLGIVSRHLRQPAISMTAAEARMSPPMFTCRLCLLDEFGYSYLTRSTPHMAAARTFV